MITAKKIEPIVNTGSVHVLYSVDGTFYECPKDFPATLFDIDGYIIFTRKADYMNNEYLSRKVKLNVADGISQIPGYQRYTEEQRRRVREMR